MTMITLMVTTDNAYGFSYTNTDIYNDAIT